jgi:hypothetical protein
MEPNWATIRLLFLAVLARNVNFLKVGYDRLSTSKETNMNILENIIRRITHRIG